MRALLQRVSQARVRIEGQAVGSIGLGLVVLLGVGRSDDESDVNWLVGKIAGLRIFPDDQSRMNQSIQEIGGGILVVSQFTLFADTKKGRRPSFMDAAEPAEGKRLYNLFVSAMKETGLPVVTGQFGAMMDVHLTNQGPVTIWLDSKAKNQS